MGPQGLGKEYQVGRGEGKTPRSGRRRIAIPTFAKGGFAAGYAATDGAPVQASAEETPIRSMGVCTEKLTPESPYCVTVFTMSPSLYPAPVAIAHTADCSSTSITFTVPMEVLSRRSTFPVAGSLISRGTRSTVNWSPTFN